MEDEHGNRWHDEYDRVMSSKEISEYDNKMDQLIADNNKKLDTLDTKVAENKIKLVNTRILVKKKFDAIGFLEKKGVPKSVVDNLQFELVMAFESHEYCQIQPLAQFLIDEFGYNDYMAHEFLLKKLDSTVGLSEKQKIDLSVISTFIEYKAKTIFEILPL